MEDKLKVILAVSNIPPSWEAFITIVWDASTASIKYEFLNHELELDWSSSEKIICKRFRHWRLRSTRFGRPTEQSRKKFFPTAEKCSKLEQVPGKSNLQLLQETQTYQGRLPRMIKLNKLIRMVANMTRLATSALQPNQWQTTLIY